MTKVLVTGAFGQIGTELTAALRASHGAENVIATGRSLPAPDFRASMQGPSERLDVTDARAVADSIERHDIDVIYHLAAILSAHGESDPQTT